MNSSLTKREKRGQNLHDFLDKNGEESLVNSSKSSIKNLTDHKKFKTVIKRAQTSIPVPNKRNYPDVVARANRQVTYTSNGGKENSFHTFLNPFDRYKNVLKTSNQSILKNKSFSLVQDKQNKTEPLINEKKLMKKIN